MDLHKKGNIPLLRVAAQYIEGGRDLSGLIPLHAAQLSLPPPDWVSDHYMFRDPEEQPLLNRMLLTKSDRGNDIAVGVDRFRRRCASRDTAIWSRGQHDSVFFN